MNSRLLALMKERGIGDVPVIIGGIVPEEDEALLKEMGVKEIFHPFTRFEIRVECVRSIGDRGGLSPAR